jgi:hypothetical protein
MVAANGDTLSVPRPAIYHFEMSQGRRAHTKQGLLIGAGAGGAVAIILRSVGCGGSPTTEAKEYFLLGPMSCADDGMLTALGIGAAIGIPVGGLIGRFGKTDDWVRITLERNPREP